MIFNKLNVPSTMNLKDVPKIIECSIFTFRKWRVLFASWMHLFLLFFFLLVSVVYNFRSRRGENNPSGFLQESDDRYFLFQPEEFTVRPAASGCSLGC